MTEAIASPGRGGARPGAGRPAGTATDETKRYAKARADREELEVSLTKIKVQDQLMELARKRGDLLPIAEYERVLSLAIKSLVNWCETLPDILEREAGLQHDQVEVVQRCVDRERETLYAVLGKIK